MNFGIAMTELSSRLGVLSRKASMRLAEETGIKMVDRTREVGRALNKSEIEEVFAETLPKRCRPKIIATPEEGVPYMVNTGYKAEDALSQLRTPGMGAMNIPNGFGRRPIYVPMNLYPAQTQNGIVAHELEHALETNCRPKFIWKRKFEMLIPKSLGKIDKIFHTNFKDRLMAKMMKLRKESFQMELQLQRMNGTGRMIDPAKDATQVLECAGTKEGLASFNYQTEEQFSNGIKEAIRERYQSPTEYASNAKRKYKTLNQIMDIEKPAYTTQGKVEKYAFNLGENEIAAPTGTAMVYDEAQQIIKAERKLYKQNLSKGTLEIPAAYNGKKDLYRLCATKEERKVLYGLIKNMNEQERIALFKQLRWHPNVKIADIKTFLDKTTVNGKSIYTPYINRLAEVNSKAFSNPEFMEAAMLTKDGEPLFGGVLHELSNKKPEDIRKFLELAKIEDPKICRYLAEVIDHPQFESLKNIAKIELDGEYAYAGRIFNLKNLPQNEIVEWERKLIQAAKEGKDINKELDNVIESSERIFAEDFNISSLLEY